MPDYFNYVLANFACIVFLSIVAFTLIRGVDKQVSTMILIRIILLLICYFVSDSAWVLFERGVFRCSEVAMYMITTIPYICLLTAACQWFVYCEVVQGGSKIFSRQGILLTAIPLFAAFLILAIGVFTEYLFVIDDNGYLEYGPLYMLLLCGPFGYLIVSSLRAFYKAFTRNRYYDHGLYLAMGLFPLTPLACGILQSVFLTVPIMCYGATAAVLLLYITATNNRISTDALTKINNRQEMQRYLALKMKSRTQGHDLYLMILDVDHFKGINDKYGHVEGDKALVIVAKAMKRACTGSRNRAFLSRYGGDEFIIIMEAESEQKVEKTASMIRSNITKLNEESGAQFRLEACIGYAKYDYDNPMTIPQFIAKADEKLYEMKNNR